MMKPTLLILAAGMASRYGSMKQTEGFGPAGETIMDYSIYSAIEAGFGKVVFIIRKDFADNFRQSFEPKLSGKIAVEYVFQELEYFADKKNISPERTKPWGTGHAMLCAKDSVNEPFAVINADDFYGKDAFKKAADFLIKKCSEKEYAIIGYRLANTLSDFGTVSRGVCETDQSNRLTEINERTKIFRKDGKIVYEESEAISELPESTNVSMNFWCFHPSVFIRTAELFTKFTEESKDNIKAEFFIPYIGSDFIKNCDGTINVIPTNAQWFGVTYKEDAPGVKESLHNLIKEGEYPSALWS